jgi:hypothetical protein
MAPKCEKFLDSLRIYKLVSEKFLDTLGIYKLVSENFLDNLRIYKLVSRKSFHGINYIFYGVPDCGRSVSSYSYAHYIFLSLMKLFCPL